MTRVYKASDYIGIQFDGGELYYGYEEIKDDEWCFTARFDNQDTIIIPFSELGTDDMFDVVKNFNSGIAILFTRRVVGFIGQ